MAFEAVREYFIKAGMGERVLEFDVSSATVELAAQAIGCSPERIAKSLSFKVGEEAVLIVAAGDAKVDNKKFKDQFNTKAKMLTPEEVEAFIGHSVGGVCPFVVKAGVKIYLDVSMKRFTSVYPACGSSNSVIKLTLEELEQHSNYVEWVDVCKNWEA